MSKKDEYLTMAGYAATAIDGLSHLYDWLGGTAAPATPTLSELAPAAATQLGASLDTASATGVTFAVPVDGRTVPVFAVQVDDRLHLRSPAVPFDPTSNLSMYLLHRNHKLTDVTWEVTEERHRFVADCRGSLPRNGLTAADLAKAVFALAREFDATVNG